MIRRFLKRESGPLTLFVVIMITIAACFFLLNLPMEAFGVIFWLLIIYLAIYLVGRAVAFRQEMALEEELDALKEELAIVKEESWKQRSDLEEYFIMWVHQMKTPITASQLILNDPDEGDVASLRQEMLNIENYTNMALNYIKVSNPSTDMVITRVVLDEIISPLIRKYRTQFIHKKIRLNYQPIDTAVITEVNLSSLMIEQILNNALKYTDSGDIWIEFDSETGMLMIKDSGKGIKTQDLPKIFDKGYSGFNGQLNQKSSGIGLYLVKMISQRLDQEVKVHSTPSKGTTFTIQFHRND